MPTKLKNNCISTYLDFEKEIFEPQKHKYYLESIAKLDAFIDSLLDSLLRQLYSERQCQTLMNAVEKAMKKHYRFVSGLVRLEILKIADKEQLNPRIKLPSKKLELEIRKFKEMRNKALHSELGYYALVGSIKYKSDEKFQYQAKEEANKIINLGVKCCTEIQILLQDNASSISSSSDPDRPRACAR